MPTGRITSTLSIGGVSMYSTITRNEEGQIGQEVTLPAAAAGELTTRTDDNTGEITLSAGHSVVTGKVNVFWDGGLRYGVDAVVTGNACAIDAGAGNPLPAQGTAVTVANQVEIDTDFDGSAVVLIGALSTKRTHVEFRTPLDSSIMGMELAASEAWEWHSDSSMPYPLSGETVGKVLAANAATAAAKLKLGVLYSSV